MDYIASHTIDPVTMHGKGIVYVVDPNGQIILHPDRQKMIGNAMIEQAILEPISDGGAGSFENDATAWPITAPSIRCPTAGPS